MPKEDLNISIDEVMVDFLHRQLTSGDKPKMALEFGTGAGFATYILSQYSNKVVTVYHDAEWMQHAKMILNIMPNRAYDNIIFVTGYDDIPTFDEPYDFLFVDDALERVAVPIMAVWDRLTSGCVIVVDDTMDSEMQKFVQVLSRSKNCVMMLSATGRGFGVLIK